MSCFLSGVIQVLRNADQGGGVSGGKQYEGVSFKVISVTSGWVGVQFPRKNVRNTLVVP